MSNPRMEGWKDAEHLARAWWKFCKVLVLYVVCGFWLLAGETGTACMYRLSTWVHRSAPKPMTPSKREWHPWLWANPKWPRCSKQMVWIVIRDPGLGEERNNGLESLESEHFHFCCVLNRSVLSAIQDIELLHNFSCSLVLGYVGNSFAICFCLKQDDPVAPVSPRFIVYFWRCFCYAFLFGHWFILIPHSMVFPAWLSLTTWITARHGGMPTRWITRDLQIWIWSLSWFLSTRAVEGSKAWKFSQ